MASRNDWIFLPDSLIVNPYDESGTLSEIMGATLTEEYALRPDKSNAPITLLGCKFSDTYSLEVKRKFSGIRDLSPGCTNLIYTNSSNENNFMIVHNQFMFRYFTFHKKEFNRFADIEGLTGFKIDEGIFIKKGQK